MCGHGTCFYSTGMSWVWLRVLEQLRFVWVLMLFCIFLFRLQVWFSSFSVGCLSFCFLQLCVVHCRSGVNFFLLELLFWLAAFCFAGLSVQVRFFNHCWGCFVRFSVLMMKLCSLLEQCNIDSVNLVFYLLMAEWYGCIMSCCKIVVSHLMIRVYLFCTVPKLFFCIWFFVFDSGSESL